MSDAHTKTGERILALYRKAEGRSFTAKELRKWDALLKRIKKEDALLTDLHNRAYELERLRLVASSLQPLPYDPNPE